MARSSRPHGNRATRRDSAADAGPNDKMAKEPAPTSTESQSIISADVRSDKTSVPWPQWLIDRNAEWEAQHGPVKSALVCSLANKPMENEASRIEATSAHSRVISPPAGTKSLLDVEESTRSSLQGRATPKQLEKKTKTTRRRISRPVDNRALLQSKLTKPKTTSDHNRSLITAPKVQLGKRKVDYPNVSDVKSVHEEGEVEDDETEARALLARFQNNDSRERPYGGRKKQQSGRNSPAESISVPSAAPQAVKQPLNTHSAYQALELPAWYTQMTDRAIANVGKRPSPTENQALKAFQSMKRCIERCEAAADTPAWSILVEELRDHVHKAEICLKVNGPVIRRAKMLHKDVGLPSIFAGMIDFPWDLKADARQLYKRWWDEIFEVDLLRGIRTGRGIERNADSLDPLWERKKPAKFHGEGDLIPGQWWPTQLCAVRDGAHGSMMGGIYGERNMGAFSVVLSGGTTYDDEDHGDEIWYSGTKGDNFTTTENTLRLIESCDEIHKPVRVLRSHQLPKKNRYRPMVGLRYDGLYDVVAKRLVNQQQQIYQFKLVRCPYQYPIRCENNAARRPTRFEIEAYEKLREGRIANASF